MHEALACIRRFASLAALATAWALCAPVPALAQLSPGPLARAHADLDGTTSCLKCHTRGKSMTDQCLACHTEIQTLRNLKRGFHGKRAAGDCQTCHPDHAGRDFNLIHWEEGSEQAFDHAKSGWPLEGAHAKTECRDCHQPKYQQTPMVTHLQKKDHATSWLALETRCQSCHEDPHKTRFGNDCMKCHNQSNWHETREGSFDHDLTKYPLRGKHAKLECETCHDEKKAWGPKPRFAECRSCHQDAHAGRALLAGKNLDCESCHGLHGFSPSTMPLSAHAKTAYPLEGKHTKVACAECHVKSKAPRPDSLGTAGVVMRPRFDACARCHADAHGGQLASRADKGACESCHDVQAFQPSHFTVKDHAKLEFALDGAHEKAACLTCHGAARKDLPRPAGAEKAGKAKFVFAIAEQSCAECHSDVHEGSLALQKKGSKSKGCIDCHSTAHFRPSAVDVQMHASFAFALEGAHRATPCAACHEPLKGKARGAGLLLSAHASPVRFTIEDRACVKCHETPHGTQFADRRDKGACETCHAQQAFVPASAFRHDRDARFKLEGAHAEAKCSACHVREPAVVGGRKPIVKYRGTPRECAACHDDLDRGSTPGVDAGSAQRKANRMLSGHTPRLPLMFTTREVPHARRSL